MSAVHASSVWERIDARVARVVGTRSSTGAHELEFAELLRDIAAAGRTGATLAQALEQASTRGTGRVARELRRTSARILMGESAERAVHAFATALDTQQARLFAQVVAIQHRRGGDLSGPCHRLATLLHERGRLEVEARAATAQARFTSRAVIAIPFALAVLATWRAPDMVREMLDPAVALLALPGLLLIGAGSLVASRISRRAVAIAGADVRPQPTRATDRGRRASIERIAGHGPLSRRSARLGGSAAIVVVPIVLLTNAGHTAAAVAIGAALAWPWSHAARSRRRDVEVVTAGIESLLEVSIALFAAGATAHEVATIAPSSCTEPMRTQLEPAVHGIGLGQGIHHAFRAIPLVQRSAPLDAWLHAVCSTAELGSRAVPVLDQLLRDARSRRREQLRAAAQTAGPRMQLALVLLVVPGVMWLMLLATASSLLEQLRAAGVA